MRGPFDKLVREVRQDWGTREAAAIDWATVDDALFARLDRERREDSGRFAPGRSRRWGVALAGVLALAAVLVVAVGKGREAPPDDKARSSGEENGGVVVAVEGRAFVNRALVGRGTVVRLGDVIESGGRLTIDRPGRLSVVLESDSRVTVTHVRGALVLALERGALEASVVPVPSGEAFAVDVEHSRVAAHGTHLRVARAGSQAVVDLTEGVISIGEAPRAGAVLGTMVVSPAHAEFGAADAQGTLKVTHDVSAVRSAAAFGTAAAVLPIAASAPLQATAQASSARASIAAAAQARVENKAPSGAPTPPGTSETDASAALASAVRACMAERQPAENVTVVVKTTLYLVLQDDGTVRSARFEPPVAVDVNECATPSIYKARFTHGGSTSLVLSYVSK